MPDRLNRIRVHSVLVVGDRGVVELEQRASQFEPAGIDGGLASVRWFAARCRRLVVESNGGPERWLAE